MSGELPTVGEFLELLELSSGAVVAPPIRDVEARRRTCTDGARNVTNGLRLLQSDGWSLTGSGEIMEKLVGKFRPEDCGYFFTGRGAETLYRTGMLPSAVEVGLVGHTAESATAFLKRLGNGGLFDACTRTAEATEFRSRSILLTVYHTLWDDLPQLLDSGAHIAADASTVWTSPTQYEALTKYGAFFRHLPEYIQAMDTIVCYRDGVPVPSGGRVPGLASVLALEIESGRADVSPDRVTDIGARDIAAAAGRIADDFGLLRECSDPAVAALAYAQRGSLEGATLGRIAIRRRLAQLLRDADRSQYLWTRHQGASCRATVARMLRSLDELGEF